MKEFYSIGEIAALYHLSPHTIRYYEELGILTPQRADNGYRLYTTSDTWKLNVIRELRQLDFPMEDIAAYFKNRNVDSTIEILEKELEYIRRQEAFLKDCRDSVTRRLTTFRDAKTLPLDQVQMLRMPARPCFCLHEPFSRDADMDFLVRRLQEAHPGTFYFIGNRQIGSMITMENVRSRHLHHYHSVFAIHPDGDELLPEGNYLAVAYRGDYTDGNARCIPLLLSYLEEARLKADGDLLELVWVDIHTTGNRAEYLTQLQLKVKNI